MTPQNQADKVTLYFREGSSDKVYQASIEPSAGGFLVNFAYGRRGSTMQTGTKTAKPVDHAAAKKIFDKLVQEKTAKGYTPGEDGTPYQHTDKEQQSTGIVPQLLNPIDESEVELFLTDDRWWMQEKFDGKRMLIRKDGDTITGINRIGLMVGLPQKIADAVRQLDVKQCLLDSEAIGDLCQAFDLLERDGVDLRKKPYIERYPDLVDLVDPLENLYLPPVANIKLGGGLYRVCGGSLFGALRVSLRPLWPPIRFPVPPVARVSAGRNRFKPVHLRRRANR